MSIIAKISTAISNELLKELPSELAKRFKLKQDDVDSFMKEWIGTHLGKTVKQKKDTSLPKRVSGYTLFCSEERAKLNEKEKNKPKEKKTKATDAMKLFGEAWKKLSDKEKEKYAIKAMKQNEANGIITGKGSKKIMEEKAKTKAKMTKKVVDSDDDEEKVEDDDEEKVEDDDEEKVEDDDEEKVEDDDDDEDEDEDEDEEPEQLSQKLVDEWFKAGKNGKTMAELKELAQKYSIKIKSNMKKPDLKALFEAQLENDDEEDE